MAETYKSRPSELVGVDDPYVAWCVDEAAFAWGTAVDAAVGRARASEEDHGMANRAATAELQRLMSQPVLDESGEEVVPRGRFRDPAVDMAAIRARGRRPQ